MLRYTASIVLLLAVSWTSFAQVDSTGSRPPKPPKVKKELKEFIPTGVRLGVDIYSIGRGFWEDEKTLQEYQLEVDLRHYLLFLNTVWQNWKGQEMISIIIMMDHILELGRK